MLTKEDSKKLVNDMKRVFVTKDDLDKILDQKFKKHTKVIVDEVKKVLDTVGIALDRLDKYKRETNEVFDDHEKRLDILEKKAFV